MQNFMYKIMNRASGEIVAIISIVAENEDSAWEKANSIIESQYRFVLLQ